MENSTSAHADKRVIKDVPTSVTLTALLEVLLLISVAIKVKEWSCIIFIWSRNFRSKQKTKRFCRLSFEKVNMNFPIQKFSQFNWSSSKTNSLRGKKKKRKTISYATNVLMLCCHPLFCCNRPTLLLSMVFLRLSRSDLKASRKHQPSRIRLLVEL